MASKHTWAVEQTNSYEIINRERQAEMFAFFLDRGINKKIFEGRGVYSKKTVELFLGLVVSNHHLTSVSTSY